MHKVIQISEEVYNRIEPRTNKVGARSPKKVGFSAVISKALDALDRQEKKKIGGGIV